MILVGGDAVGRRGGRVIVDRIHRNVDDLRGGSTVTVADQDREAVIAVVVGVRRVDEGVGVLVERHIAVRGLAAGLQAVGQRVAVVLVGGADGDRGRRGVFVRRHAVGGGNLGPVVGPGDGDGLALGNAVALSVG